MLNTAREEKKLPAAVIFDMDGVLADTEPMHGKCFVRAFAGFGIFITLEDYRQAVTLGGSTVRDYFISLGGDPSDWDRVKDAKDSYMREIVAEHDSLMPGVIGLLELLRSAGVRTAVATSARRRSLNLIIDRYGLRPYFEVTVTKDEAQAEKPDPRPYIVAAERLGVDPKDCVAIEDSPRGIIAAVRAGMKCIAVPTPSTADGDFSLATLVVRSLEEIDLEVLSRLA
ncbi:MAG: HAD family phosphatase [Armatimonadetes bacterium]|nr:HAD family phosphatase [Armatimonadota bacterium]